MFDIGFAELLAIAVVGLLVIGPEQLPGTVRTVMLWLGRLRSSFSDVRRDIEREIGAEDIRRQLHNESVMRELEKTRKDINSIADDARDTIAESKASIEADLTSNKQSRDD
ncbi:MAG: Sec-independent protein translocase protein TatB [Pseudomonadales bacterium]